MNKEKVNASQPLNMKINPLLSLCFAILLVVSLLVNLVFPDSSYSQVENRPLATIEKPGAESVMDGKWQDSVNSWFADQLVGRNLFFHANYLWNKLIGTEEIQDVFLGKHQLYGQNEQAEKDANTKNATAINDFAAKTGLPTLLAIAPSSTSIQKENLPAFAPVYDNYGLMDQAYGLLKDNARPVDLRQVLDEHKKEYIYYLSDHHWTTLGAGYAYSSIAAAQGVDFNLEDFETMLVSDSFEGTYASKTGSVGIEDDINIAIGKNNPEYVVTNADGSKSPSIYQSQALSQKDQYEVFLGANQSLVRIETTNTGDRHLLILKDSYANSMIQYMLPYFRTITVIDPRYFYDDLDLILNTYGITDVLCLFSADIFNTDTSLTNVLATIDDTETAQEG